MNWAGSWGHAGDKPQSVDEFDRSNVLDKLLIHFDDRLGDVAQRDIEARRPLGIGGAVADILAAGDVEFGQLHDFAGRRRGLGGRGLRTARNAGDKAAHGRRKQEQKRGMV